MALVWNEIRPADGFRINLGDSLSSLHVKTLTHLYQPILGSTSYALYLTMAHEVEGERFFSLERSHQWLMNIMNLPLDSIYHARLRLEALGLIRTYQSKKEDEFSLFEYSLLVPLSPQEFFEDDILSICLYNNLGANRYKELRAKYSSYFIDSPKEVPVQKKEITKEFHEVFSSLSPSELIVYQGSEIHKDLTRWKEDYPLPDTPRESQYLQFDSVKLDLDSLKTFMMKGLDFNRIVNKETLPLIKKLAYFYQLDEWSMSRIIQDSLTVDERLDVNRLRQEAKGWYRLQEGGKPPKILQQTQPVHKQTIHKKKEEERTEEEKHLIRLENLSPLQLLKAYQGGGKVADADLKLVEELVVEYQLYPGVVNVLIEYIYLTNDFKLPRNLVTKVAAHWKRLKIEDSKRALEMAKKEHQQYKQWKEQQKDAPSQGKSSRRYPAKAMKKDQLPAWIEEQKKESAKENHKTPKKSEESAITDQQKLERMKYLLQALGEWDDQGGKKGGSPT